MYHALSQISIIRKEYSAFCSVKSEQIVTVYNLSSIYIRCMLVYKYRQRGEFICKLYDEKKLRN